MPFEKVGVRATVEGVQQYVRDAGRIDRSTASMGRGVQGVASNFRVSTTQALRFGAAMFGVQLGISVMSRSIIGLQQGTVGAAIAFESSFAGIRKTMQLTEEEFDQLALANRDLAKAIPVSVNELNRIGELAGQLGVQGVENVLEFEDTIAKLSVTTDLSADSAALAFAQIANVIQLPLDQIDNLASAVVGLGNTFPAVESQIVGITQALSGAAKLAGITAGELVGIATALASVGANAQAAGTATQRVFFAMTEAVIEGGRELEVFAIVAGTTMDEFAALVREDASEAFTLFVEGLGRSGEDAIRVLDELGLADARIAREFLKLAGAGDTLSRAITQGTRDFDENIAANEEAAKRFDTTASKLQLLRNGFNDIGIAAGDALLLGLEPLLEATQEWLDTNGDQFAKDLAGAIEGGIDFARELADEIGRLAGFMQELSNLGPIELAIDVVDLDEAAKLTLVLAAMAAGGLTFGPVGALVLGGLTLGGIVISDLFAGGEQQTLEGLIAERQRTTEQLAEIVADIPVISELFGEDSPAARQQEALVTAATNRLAEIDAELRARTTRASQAEREAVERILMGGPGPAVSGAPGEEGDGKPPPVFPPGFFDEVDKAAARERERLRRQRIAELDQFGALIIAALRRRAEAELEVELGTIEEERSARTDQLDERLGQIESWRQASVDGANAVRDEALDALQQERRDREDALRDRLREIGDERDAALAGIDVERRARENALRDRLREIDAERDAAIEAIDSEANRRIEALEAELGLQDAESDTEERARLERAIALSFDAKDRADAEQALRDFERSQRADAIRDEIADIRDAARTEQDVVRERARAAVEAAKERDRELSELEDARADAIRQNAADEVEIARDRDRELRRIEQDRTEEIREELRTRLDDIADAAEKATAIAQQSFEDDVAILDAREEAARLTFEQITADWALESEARRLIQEEENEAIGKLLDAFVPEWRAAGLSFGEALIEGLEAAGVVAFVAIMFQRLQELLDTLKTAEDRAREVLAGTTGAAAAATGESASAFPHGGLVGTRGQRIPILVEPGELVLNARQQQTLFGAGGAGGVTFERGAFAGMFDGATLTGTVEENERMIERTFERLMDRTLGRGAFTQGVV